MGNRPTTVRSATAMLACCLAIATSACGSDDGTAAVEQPAGDDERVTDDSVPDTTSPDRPTASTVPIGNEAAWPDDPPPLVFEPGRVELSPFTTCWQSPPNSVGEYEGYCADGMVADSPPVIEPVDGQIRFSFAVEGWSFEARYFSQTEAIPDTVLAVAPTGATSWTISVPEERPADIVMVSGFGPQGDVHVAFSLPPSVRRLDCADGFDEIVSMLRSGLPLYDYDRTESTAELAARSDAVVTGRLSSIGHLEIDDEDVGPGSYATITIQDVSTLSGSSSAPDPFEVLTGATGTDLGAIEIAGGVGVLAFVHHEPGTSPPYVVDVQGLAVNCNDGPLVDVIEPLPGDLAELPLDERARLIGGQDPPG